VKRLASVRWVGLWAALSFFPPFGASDCGATVLNDVHSRLNPTEVAEVFEPESTEDVVRIVRTAKEKKMSVSISGGRHAMGGQQFGEGTFHVAMSKMNDVVSFDAEKGIVKVEAGIGWPKLMDYLAENQKDSPKPWGIVQKQTGADTLTIGGALSANAHGRGVRFKPFVQDVESFTLVNAEGDVLNASRTENPELFSLVIGGYGLFGVIATVDLRLSPRIKLQRTVEIVALEDLHAKVKERLESGFLYGDFQYKTDEKAEDFMKKGVLSAYKPAPSDTEMPSGIQKMSAEAWNKLLLLAHTDKSKAFEAYARYYQTTDGRVYWSDTHQMSYYNPDYADYLTKAEPALANGSLMISELYVPRERLPQFVEIVREDAKTHGLNVVYGTVRLIERDDETFLAWAKRPYACVIFNLRVEHSPEGIEKAKRDFRRLIDRALELEGSYFLTYHRWARKDQVLLAYPLFPQFLKKKIEYDPEERFQSEWYRHYKAMFSE